MAEVHVLVAPVRGHELRLRPDQGDQLLLASKLRWFVHCVDVEESGADWDGLQKLLERGVVRLVRHVELVRRHETQLPGEHWRLVGAVLASRSHFRQADSLNEL